MTGLTSESDISPGAKIERFTLHVCGMVQDVAYGVTAAVYSGREINLDVQNRESHNPFAVLLEAPSFLPKHNQP